MTTLIAAGIDVGRDSLDIAIAPSGRSFRAPNIAQGIAVVVDRLQRVGVRRVVLESIGSYAQRLVRALADAGFEVGIVDPRRIHALRLAEGKRAKTDRLDARLIARFALFMRDTVRPIPDTDALKLRALSTRRRQLVEMIAMEKTRLKQALDPEIVESLKSTLVMLTAERARVERQLESGRAAPAGGRAAPHAPRQRTRRGSGRRHNSDRRSARARPPQPQGHRQPRRIGPYTSRAASKG